MSHRKKNKKSKYNTDFQKSNRFNENSFSPDSGLYNLTFKKVRKYTKNLREVEPTKRDIKTLKRAVIQVGKETSKGIKTAPVRNPVMEKRGGEIKPLKNKDLTKPIKSHCEKRSEKRRVLFSLRKTGKGSSHKNKTFDETSNLKCNKK